MTHSGNVVVIVDGPDPDNYACALAATSEALDLNVVAAIVTGRPVSSAQDAKPHDFRAGASKAVRRDNALHMKGILTRHGRGRVPVFEGNRAPYTTVPHGMHIHERVIDIYDDAHADFELAGDFDQAVQYLAGIPGPLHIVCGGPLTDAARLACEPTVREKLGIITAQLGMFGSPNVKTIAGGRRQFNVIADPFAAEEILTKYWNAVYLIPTDITKDPAHAFDDPDDIAALSQSDAFGELAEMYKKAWPVMWGPRNEKIYVHDFHAAELMSSLLYSEQPPHRKVSREAVDIGRYTTLPAGIGGVPTGNNEKERWGEIDLTDKLDAWRPRFRITRVDTSTNRDVLSRVLN
ncbi:MAG: nucleoside hydrolase, partial [Terriglobales bacterium]